MHLGIIGFQLDDCTRALNAYLAVLRNHLLFFIRIRIDTENLVLSCFKLRISADRYQGIGNILLTKEIDQYSRGK